MTQLIAENHFLYEVDDNGELYKCSICEEFDVVEKWIDLISKSAYLKIVTWLNGEPSYTTIERKKFTKETLATILRDRGLNFYSDNDTVTALFDYATLKDSNLSVRFFHSTRGFKRLGGELCYLNYNVIGTSSNKGKSSINMTLAENGDFEKNEETEMRGSFDGWLQVINDEVLSNIPLEIALALGVSAPIAHLLREQSAFSEVTLVALVGCSTTGKTTALRLMASIWGSIQEGRIIKDFNTTKNAFFKQMSDALGAIHIFDEATVIESWELSHALYSLSKGIEKATCSSARKINPRSRFSGTVVFSAENSVLQGEGVNLGMHARLLELTLPWTNDGDHSRRLCSKLNFEHGTAVEPLMIYILTSHKADDRWLRMMFEDEISMLKSEKPITESVFERIYNIIATILVSAKVANEAWGITLNVDGMRKVLLDTVINSNSIDRSVLDLYDTLINSINSNRGAYITHLNKNQSMNRIKGEFATYKGRNIVWVDKEEFKNVAKSKVTNYQPLIKKMCDKNLLIEFSGRHYTCSHKLNGIFTQCYALVLPIGGSVPQTSKKKLKKKGSSTQMKSLLSNEE